MIKNDIDFDYAIKKIIAKTNPKIQEQGEILDSKKFNYTFTQIENTLNTLYEKTRYLEDSIQYAKVFLDTKVREFNNEMQSTMKELESLLDMSKNLSYISYNVPLKANSIPINDRDSTVNGLSPLIVKENALTLGYKSSKTFEPSSVDRKCDSIPYDDNLKTMCKDKKYTTIYLEEKAIADGLRETLVFYFANPITINILDFKSVNSSIRNIRFGLINGIEESASDYNLSIKNEYRTCIYIKIDLVCTNYNTVIYEVEKDKITENLWNDLKEYEMSKITSLNKTNKLNSEYIISRTTFNKITGEQEKVNFTSPKGKTTVNLKLYSYIFGLDTFTFMDCVQQQSGYFTSDPINIGQLTSAEYISLYASFVKDENTSVEFSIMDGEVETPILPIDVEYIDNEPIFGNLETRFTRIKNVNSKDYIADIIKKDGQLTNINFEDALTMKDGQYSISYKPETIVNWAYPLNREIRVRAYIRTYGTNVKNIPYIDMITIRKFGEETLWTNKY